jgi:hypothetical protein
MRVPHNDITILAMKATFVEGQRNIETEENYEREQTKYFSN